MRITLSTLFLAIASAHAQQSTLGVGDSYAWAANLGWIEMMPNRPNAGDGFRFGEFSCSGWLWSNSTGWIHCGDGTPADGISYANNINTDYGVNHYATGDLYGLAWSPNTGWINFGWWTLDPNNANRPRVDLYNGTFTGYAWSANCGWINLNSGYLKTDSMIVTDSDRDGIADPWEISYTGGLGTMNGSSDQDGDGFTDKAEYLAMTHPLDRNSFFKVTQVTPVNPSGSATSLTWTSSRARVYRIERSADLGITNPWHVSNLDAPVFYPDNGSTTTRTTLDTAAPKRFFRVQSRIPLQP
jgi:hypothetical protein